MYKIKRIDYKDLKDVCGKPGDKLTMVKAPFPFPLYLGGIKDGRNTCRNFFGSPLIVKPVIDAFDEILRYYGIDFIQKNNLNWYGGCYEDRPSRMSSLKSVHAWGMAVDYLPQMGLYKCPDVIPHHIVKIFKDRGFAWGGDWNVPDGMHFTAVNE